MEQDREQAKQVLHQLMELGEAMLVNGAEVNRVEDTLVRLGAAYGAAQMHVFVITSSMIITMVLPDGDEITQTRRILGAGGTDFKKVEALNALSRRCCSQPLPIAELASEIGRLKRAAPDPKYLCLGSALAAGSFAVFYGGGLKDGILAALFGLLIYAMQDCIAPFCMNKVIFNLLAAFLSGIGICLCGRIAPGLQVDKIMIGDIMLLIPGIAMTNAIRDILIGDTIAGLMRLIESLLWACALACGFMLAMSIVGVRV